MKDDIDKLNQNKEKLHKQKAALDVKLLEGKILSPQEERRLVLVLWSFSLFVSHSCPFPGHSLFLNPCLHGRFCRPSPCRQSTDVGCRHRTSRESPCRVGRDPVFWRNGQSAMFTSGYATRCIDKIRQLIFSRCHNVETLAGGYYNRHKLHSIHSLPDVGPMLWPHPWSTCMPTTLVLVPYAYPARLR